MRHGWKYPPLLTGLCRFSLNIDMLQAQKDSSRNIMLDQVRFQDLTVASMNMTALWNMD